MPMTTIGLQGDGCGSAFVPSIMSRMRTNNSSARGGASHDRRADYRSIRSWGCLHGFGASMATLGWT